MARLMIYGATGYTARLVAEQAAAAGLDLILGGRNASKLEALASTLGARFHVFGLDDERAIDSGLEGVSVLLNAAGPYIHTAAPLMGAALRSQIHYLDFAAELDSYTLAQRLDTDAEAAGVMLMPGCGGSVAMLGSLAAHAAARVPGARKVRIALRVAGAMSRGSAISAAENIADVCLRMASGKLIMHDPRDVREFDFGRGQVSCFPVTLPDIITIHRALGVPDVEAFIHVSGGAFPSGDMSLLHDGPTAREREADRYQAAVEVIGQDGTAARSQLDTVNGYTFTAMAAAEAARRVLSGESRPGFQTPVGLFGNGFAETIADTTIVDS